ncbi:MAG: flagellar hook-length control protein FliK [Betaproteobacteria bacterium]|nr:flagellar hook-length control protein FliK [Betaproteobacteria bacterium]
MAVIPAEIASLQLKLIGDLTGKPLPVGPVPRISDVLRDLTPGQRFVATIQAQLSDGTYRANVAGHNLTLALPFAAKAGDSLELETVEKNGKTMLAVVARGSGEGSAGKESGRADPNASTAIRLTPTGKLIASLLAGIDKEGGKRPQPVPLNNAQPIFEKLPAKTADIASALRTALVRSGMFYESHQVRWTQGRITLAALLFEPQGRLSPVAHTLAAGGESTGAARLGATPQPQSPAQPGLQATLLARPGAVHAAAPSTAPAPSAANPAQSAATAPQTAPQNPSATPAAMPSSAAMPESGAVRVGMGQAIAPDLAPVVRQQLEALATNTYVWQGQIWPGQTMDWEIIEEDSEQRQREENTAANWTTRLHMKLPSLGALEATLRLSGGRDIQIILRTENDVARARLIAANAELRRRFETSGLSLEFVEIHRHVRRKDTGAPA